MRNSLEHILRQRLLDHESDVDPGTWQAIQERLSATMAAGGDGINDLFRERLQGHEMDVDPGVWDDISQRLGHDAPAGKPWGWGHAAAGLALLLTAGAVYLLTGTEDASPTAKPEVAEVRTREPATTANDEITNASFPGPAATSGIGQTPHHVARLGQAGTTMPEHEGQTQEPVEGPEAPPAHNDAAGNTPSSSKGTPTPGDDMVDDYFQRITAEVEREVRQTSTETQIPSDNDPEPDPMEMDAPATAVPLPPLFMPDHFSPNGDNNCDTYIVKGEGFARVRVRVFSVLTNKMVFSTDTNEPWDGGNCENGFYMVAVEALTNDQRPVTQSKVVLLDRSLRH